MSKYKTQIVSRLKWTFMRLKGRYDYPAPAWFYPTDGWTADKKEVIRSIRLDDELGIVSEEPKK